MNIKEKKPSKKRSRAKYECPENLTTLIKWANYFPRDFPLPSIEGDEDETEYVLTPEMENLANILIDESNGEIEINRMALLGAIKLFDAKEYAVGVGRTYSVALQVVSEFPPHEFKEFLLKPSDGKNDINTLTLIRATISDFIEIVQITNDIRKGKRQFDDIKQVFAKTWLNIDENNKYRTRPESIAFRLIEGQDADRLRLCEICNKIFWATRNDKETCSPQCANTFRVRRYRSLTDEEKEINKVRRKKNQQFKNRPKTKIK